MAFATVLPPAYRSALPTADGVAPAFRLKRLSFIAQAGLECWIALPETRAKAAPPLVAIHGLKRGARDQAALLARRAAARGQVVIAPLFDHMRWPRYQQVVRKGRADRALFTLLALLQETGAIEDGPVELCGFSGGAQCAHRFAMLYPERVSRLTTSSAGWYTFPDAEPFPYGFGARDGARRASGKKDWGAEMAYNLDKFLRIPINVTVGSRDSTPDANTRSTGNINEQQGRTRLARAANWARALERAAIARNITPDVTLSVLPGCGHDFRQCVEKGGLDRIIVPGAAPREVHPAKAHAPKTRPAALTMPPPAGNAEEWKRAS